MSYINAEDVLPKNLIEEIQKHKEDRAFYDLTGDGKNILNYINNK